MGNCQAVDAATLVIQYPSGKVHQLYWPISASEVMKMNPGHYVALLLSTTLYPANNNNNATTECSNSSTTTSSTSIPNSKNSTSTSTSNLNNSNNSNNSVRLTRIKLLRPTDTLALGHVYRLITTQEVTKGLLAKKQAKLKKSQAESSDKPEERVTEKRSSGMNTETRRSQVEMINNHKQVNKSERNRGKTATSTNSATVRPKTWQPSLNSISEAGS